MTVGRSHPTARQRSGRKPSERVAVAPAAAAAMAVGVAAAAAVAFWRWFARDPDRWPPSDPHAILAPADGRVVECQPSPWPPSELPAVTIGKMATAAAEERTSTFAAVAVGWRVTVFLALWDVHVQRAPIDGRVVCAEHHDGGHWPALLARADENAGHWLAITGPRGSVVVHRSAGLVARRVRSWVAAGDRLTAGQRIGRILLGSRTTLYLPPGARPLVGCGDMVRAGETVAACWAADQRG